MTWVVVGGGPGGYAAALYRRRRRSRRRLGRKAEAGPGPVCTLAVSRAKELLETASVYRTVAHADQFGIVAGPPTVDMGAAQARKQKIVDQLHKGVGKLLEGRKVTVLDGWGALGPDHSVSVSGGESGETTVTADHVILATGSVPRTLPGFEVDGERIMTSDELLSITDLPDRAAVIGGGAIGLEFASLLADLGSEVTVLEGAAPDPDGRRRRRGEDAGPGVQEAEDRSPDRRGGEADVAIPAAALSWI